MYFPSWLKGQSKDIFDLQFFFSYSEPTSTTDQQVKTFDSGSDITELFKF